MQQNCVNFAENSPATQQDSISLLEWRSQNPPLFPGLLVGTKSDVDNIGRDVSSQEYEAWAEDNKMLAFYDVSARDNTNVDTAVKVLVDQ